jgi:2-hydroxychromene-2-carboxylate isomerase
MSNRPPSYPLPTQHLLNAAMRLAAQLEEARLYSAAAYASMAADHIRKAQPSQPETP